MNEVRSQPHLRVFGSFLAFTHLLTAYFWLDPNWGHIRYFTDAIPICWPYLSGCETWARISVNGLFGISFVYCVTAAAAGVLFFIPQRSRAAFGLLAAASLVKLGLYQLDYRLSGNFHYMHFWVLAAFLLFPYKSLTIRFLLMGFYLGAGALKLNREWLSGAAIWENDYISGAWLRAGCAYVLVLELVLVFGLLSRKRWIFWATLGQLVLFHAVSSLIVGYYYPLLFLSFLSIFVLAERESRGNFYLAKLKVQPVLSQALLVAFFAAQLMPFFLGHDRALDGRGRLFALSMFDASVQCDFKAVSKFKDPAGQIYESRLVRQYNLDQRLHCDPNVLLADARHRCRDFKRYTQFVGLDVSLKSRRKTEAEFTEIFAMKDFCARPLKINVWGRIN